MSSLHFRRLAFFREALVDPAGPSSSSRPASITPPGAEVRRHVPDCPARWMSQDFSRTLQNFRVSFSGLNVVSSAKHLRSSSSWFRLRRCIIASVICRLWCLLFNFALEPGCCVPATRLTWSSARLPPAASAAVIVLSLLEFHQLKLPARTWFLRPSWRTFSLIVEPSMPPSS